MNNTVYGAMFCCNIHESTYAVVSLHWNRKGAEMAMEFHKNEHRKENGIDNYTGWTIYEFKIN